MRPKVKYYWLLLLIPAALVWWFINFRKENKPAWHLPYYGPKYASRKQNNDTSYHSVPGFSFTGQDGQRVDQSTFQNCVYITEYFFTTCKSICPIMNNHLVKVYNTFRNREDFRILSHTVDPETDSVSVLKAYAEQHGVKDKKWLFVTGNKKELYDMARKGYLLNAEEGDGGGEDFIHTQNFALIDKERHIRGFYDGTDSLEIDRMIKEIGILLNEYDFKATAAGH